MKQLEFVGKKRITGRKADVKSVRKEDFYVKGKGFNFASACIKCGKCEEVCPQHINIREQLDRVVEVLGKK